MSQQSAEPNPILAISPDGQWVAFLGDSDDPKRRGLYLRSPSDLQSRLVRDEVGLSPFFSPDSQWLGFWANNTIWKVPVAGGQPVPICTVADRLRGASWGDDGTIVFAAPDGQDRMLWRVPATGGEQPTVITPPGQPGYSLPARPPWQHGRSGDADLGPGPIAAARDRVAADGRDYPQVVSGQDAPGHTQDGFLVYRWLETLYAQRFDLGQLNVTGESLSVLQGVSYNLGDRKRRPLPSRERARSCTCRRCRRATTPSWSGSIVRAASGESSKLGRTTERRPWIPKVVVLPSRSRSRARAVCGWNSIGAGTWTKRTTGYRTTGPIVWSLDGQWIFFGVQDTSGVPSLYRVRADVGEPERLTLRGSASGVFKRPWDRANSVNGNVLMFDCQFPDRIPSHDVAVGPSRTPEPFLETQFVTRNGQISPEGRWVADQSTEAGGQQILVRSFSSPTRGPWPAAVDAGRPQWSRDGRSLFYFRNRGHLVRSRDHDGGPGVPVGPEKRVVRFDPLEVNAGAMSTDADRFLIVNGPETERLLVYVPTFADEVKDAMRRSATSAK